MTESPAAVRPVVSRVAEAFGDAVAGLHERGGGDPVARDVVGRWAGLAWHASDEGHVCVRVDDEQELAALLASPAIGDVSRAASNAGRSALVVDADRLYLPRLHRAEVVLAARVAKLDRDEPVADLAATRACVDPLFPGVADGDPQREAVQAALRRRLALVSGGPGTGKTTTLARLLVAYASLRPDARVCFAAPTGKAAARLAQSLAEQLPRLDPQGRVTGSLPAAGMTVHRLLGRGGDASGARAAAAPLPWDLVIVDEASMLDLELAAALSVAIPEHGRLVLAGDMDQLASVEAGAVFAELCASGLGAVTRLERNYRQRDAAAIVELATAVRDRAGAQRIAQALGPHARAAEHPGRIADAALAAYAAALDALVAGMPVAQVLAEFDRFRVLTALREGEWGSLGLNRAIAARVRRRLGAPALAQWYPGRLVMVTRNQPHSGLVNGDVGLCVDAARVCFPGPQGVREVPVLAMPPCEDAFAVTVHKSQGSEFDAVDFVPAPADHPLNSRELVYTAITRARRTLRVWGDAQALAAAASVGVARDGRLRERIDDALARRD